MRPGSQILDAVTKESVPYVPTGIGNATTPSPEAFSVADNDRLLDVLQRQFSHDALVESGVCFLVDGELQLTPSLTTGSLYIALRDRPAAAPFDLQTSMGCISGELPLLASLRDYYTQQLWQGGGEAAESPVAEIPLKFGPAGQVAENSSELVERTVLVAPNLENCVSLRALGLPATSIHGLHALSRSAQERVFSEMGFDGADSRPESYSFVFLANDLTSLKPLDVKPLEQIAADWDATGEALHLYEIPVSICQFSDAEVRSIKIARNYGDHEKLAQLVRQAVANAPSAYDHSKSTAAASGNAPHIDALKGQTLEELEQTLGELQTRVPLDHKRIAQIRARISVKMEGMILAPLRKRAAEPDEPDARLLWLQLSLLGIAYRKAVAIQNRFEKSEDPLADVELNKAEEQLIELTNTIIKFESLTRGRKPSARVLSAALKKLRVNAGPGLGLS